MNSRMVQATFDDENPLTAPMWAYPDTGRWDAERNSAEFVAMLPRYRAHGLLAVTLNLQGAAPPGYFRTERLDEICRLSPPAGTPARQLAGAPGARPAVAQQRPGRRRAAEGATWGAWRRSWGPWTGWGWWPSWASTTSGRTSAWRTRRPCAGAAEHGAVGAGAGVTNVLLEVNNETNVRATSTRSCSPSGYTS